MPFIRKQTIIPNTNKNAKIKILGIPFDATSLEFPGQRFGPKAIRETIARFFGEKKGINFYKEIDDLGDLELVTSDALKTSKIITKYIKEELLENRTIFLGGDHSITYGIVSAYNKPDLFVFDAHADAFDSYEGEELSHITYLNKLISENKVNKVYLFGLREYTKEEMNFLKKNKVKIIKKIDEIKKIKSNKLYISIDLDVLDVIYAIGTATPELYGITPYELIDALKILIKNNNILALDIVELNPMLDGSRITTYYAAFILREIIYSLAQSPNQK